MNRYDGPMPKRQLFLLLSALSLYACAVQASSSAITSEQKQHAVSASSLVKNSPALDLNGFSTVEGIIPELADKRVIFIGEQHARFDHHLTQLEIIRRLHALHPPLAIGMEMFQQPFQYGLDEYLAGRFDEQAMLRATEYYQRWRMDYRNYAPILRYAREHQLPLIALNIPTELTRKLGQVGLEGLTEEERQQLPDNIVPADEAYRQRIKSIFSHHPNHGGKRFEHFLEAQLSWDEGMAERAATFLEQHPQHKLVIIAGNQHIAWGTAIPQRLQRRLPVPDVSILSSWDGAIGPGLADFLLMPSKRSLPPAGKMGVVLENKNNRVTITSCAKDSACSAAGIKVRDRITAINSEPVKDMADVRLALWDKQPGDTIKIDIERKRLLLPEKNLSYTLILK